MLVPRLRLLHFRPDEEREKRRQTANEKHELAEGDAVYFDSTVPHAYRRIGAKRTTALVVTAEL